MLESARVYPTIAVSDLDRAKEFYGGTLGLKVREEQPGGVTYEAGEGTALFVYPSQFAGTNQSTYVNFEVEDLDSGMRELRERGVVFEEYDLPGLKTVEGIADMGGIRGGWFKDPDGNILAIGERA